MSKQLSKSTVILISLIITTTFGNTFANEQGNSQISHVALFGVIRHDFQGMRGSYFLPRGAVGEQIIMGLTNRNPDARLGDGNYLVSGCRRHSCDEKAAVIVTPSMRIVAAALINFHCQRRSAHVTHCESDPRLSVFAMQSNTSQTLVYELQKWAETFGKFKVTETRTPPRRELTR